MTGSGPSHQRSCWIGGKLDRSWARLDPFLLGVLDWTGSILVDGFGAPDYYTRLGILYPIGAYDSRFDVSFENTSTRERTQDTIPHRELIEYSNPQTEFLGIQPYMRLIPSSAMVGALLDYISREMATA